ncbi:uncharacterized protein teq isoform X2 [Prorops nasuta]|uniref:uncharacterized protein teq isoform X2 n=1 Tax=Prorops nasuta TaxID=863751 RepID=UPI0034CD634E
MTPPRIFFFTLCCAHLVGLSLAIYDPRATTTKPPVRREPILPWYLAGNQSHPPDDPSRSAKWSDPDYPRQPRIISSASNGWTPWAKSPDGQIEQRTETDDARNFDQSFEQIEGLRPPDPDPPSSYRGNTHFYGDYANMAYLDFENKLPSKDRGKLHVEVQMEDNLYEGIGSDSKKPRKEKILLSEKPKLAKYDIRKGVQCPDPHITGQFVYPPDCKFFVNCWQGRAFVQPCAPGTLFNPETMECDFPHKVRCYGGELVEFQTAAYTDTAERKEPLIDGGQLHHKGENLQEPRCPPHITGMMPHPTDCAKFLQCSNGGTIVMNCGPGTVFNPAISVCDWPRNVRGCEEVDTAASKNDDFVDSLVPPNPHPHESKHQYGPKADYKDLTAARKPKCPAGYTGLLPHPDTCKKFLQCTNGGTFVMDCGPGTAFNPETTVCDWPYNVPGCSEEKPRGTSNSGSWKYTTTTAKPVPPRVPTWGPFSGSIHDGREKPDQYGYNPNQDSSNENRRNYNPNQQLPDENTQNYHPDQQYSSTQNRGIQNNSHRGINGNHWNNQQPDWNGQNNDQWLKPDSEPNFVPPSNINNNNNHHHHQHNHDWSSSDPNYSPNGGEHLHPHYHHHHQHHHNHHHFPGFNGGAVNDEFPHNHDHHRVDDESQHWDQSNFSNPSDSEPSGTQDVPRLFESSQGLNQSNHSSYKLPEELQGSSQVQGSNADNKSENRTFWSQAEMPGNQSGVFKPSTWRGIEEGNQNPNQSQGLPWNQGKSIAEKKFHELDPETNIYHQPNDKAYNSKLGGQANILQNSRGQVGTGSKSTSSNEMKPMYPNGIYVNSNGTRGHFITKELEVNQGHSQTRTSGNNNRDNSSSIVNDTYESVYDRFRPPYYSPPVNRQSNFPRSGSSTSVNRILFNPEASGLSTSFTTEKTNSAEIPSYRIVFPDEIEETHIQRIPPKNTESSAPINYPVFPATTLPSTTERATTQKGPDKHIILATKPRQESHVQRIPPRKANPVTSTSTTTTTTDPNIPSVSIEYEESEDLDQDESFNRLAKKNLTFDVPEVPVEPKLDEYDVDVLDEKEVWKPVLVFENKTKPKEEESSVIMKINKKKTDIELFNIEAAPSLQDEPPFPVYYIPPVQPLTTDKPSRRLTPISGQFIRLRGGTGPRDGYVEVQGSRPGWGIVCDSKNRWTLKEAHVVCRQLGYPRGAEMAWQGRTNKTDIPIWIAANSVDCLGNETRFQACRFKHEQECRVERDAIGVRCLANRVAHCQKDEIAHEGQCYHLAGPDTGLNHAEALEYCANRGSQLIDILSQPENNFVSEWLLQVYPEVTSIMTSGVGFTTFNRTLWLWEDASRAKFRFAKWWPGWMADKKEMPWVGSRPVCVVIKRNFPCHDRPDSICLADYYFWDVEDCATSTKGHSYICKKPYEDIGCIYGKGNQYVGKANVTMSGKECLSWGNDVVAHPLTVQVPNRDVRDSLKSHNYCRNPNPIKESRPWCFIGEYGRREYCDIPACGKIEQKRTQTTGQCKPKHFECSPGECIPAPWVCDGEEDCTNGADEKTCRDYLNLFKKSAKQRLTGYDVEKWLNTPLKTCALRCKEADFTCRSFAHKAEGNVCLLSDSNVGMTGALEFSKDFNYYEMKDRSINCDGMFVCGNRKCINQTQVCDGKNDCHDRTDESLCTVENLDYDIRLAGAESTSEGRVEVKILGVWGQVCDDNFGIINADVICKELGYVLGALEVRPGGYYGNMDPPTRFMVDQLKCRGNETSLRECDFEGWGVHNCQPEEAVGVVCKTAVDSCQEGHWKCDNSPVCIPTPFICDEVVDCDDHSDESPEHCEAPFEIRLANGSNPMEGRVEVRHHGIWGTVCDDDFTNATAKVICRSLGYGGIAIAKKNGYFGPGHGPIWLDEVFCHGNESQLYRCEHNHWGQHNCDHEEDAGVICSPGDVNDPQPSWNTEPEVAEVSIDDLLPAHCGKRAEDFDMNEDMIFEKVVRGSVAPKGSYPWQASIRVRGHSRSSHWCGAVVISPLHVLTAAHCLEGYNKGTYFVRAGDYNTDIEEGTEVEANIEDYYIHEDFRKGHRMNNDIALVLLKGRGIPLGKDVMPICLPVENTEYSAGLNCTISGFGSIETGKTTQSRNLRYGWIPLLDQSVCRAGYIYGQGAISDGMVCAGHLDEGVDTCDGDSGGPLACHHNGAFTLYGITSWGQHCGKANKPGVYVRVAHYRRWIDEKIRDSMAGR